MANLPHGYTNLTRRLDSGAVEKRYRGPRRWDNFRREVAALTALRELLPVPELMTTDDTAPLIVTRHVEGRHGQDLLAEGRGDIVMPAVGHVLAMLQALPPSVVPGIRGEGEVIVHGDFGPQNVLIDPDGREVVAVFDWESTHVGSRVEDLAWAEWIVRMHHSDQADHLARLWDAAGLRPPWQDRHRWMIRQCREVLAYCEVAGMADSASDWRRRVEITQSWVVP